MRQKQNEQKKMTTEEKATDIAAEQGGFITIIQTISIKMEDISIHLEEDVCCLTPYNLLKKALCGWKEDREPRDTFWAKGTDN